MISEEDLERAKTASLLAKKDLEAAISFYDDDEQHQNCGLHFQQAAEKLIKTLIHIYGGNFSYRKGHIMGYLREELDKTGYDLDSKFEKLDALEIYAVDGRYMVLSDDDKEDLSEHRPLIEDLLEVASRELDRVQES